MLFKICFKLEFGNAFMGNKNLFALLFKLIRNTFRY